MELCLWLVFSKGTVYLLNCSKLVTAPFTESRDENS